MLMFLGGQGLDAKGALKRKCDLLRSMCPLVSARVCLGGEFALYALETLLEVPTGLDVPANMRATLREFFYNVLVSGAQVYLPLDVLCELVVEPEPSVPPLALLRIPKADGRTSVETVDSWLDDTLE